MKNFKSGIDFNILEHQYPDMPAAAPIIEMPFRIPIEDLNTGTTIVPGYDLYGLTDLIAMLDTTPHVLDHKAVAIKPKPFLIENDTQSVLYAYVLLYLSRKGVIAPPESLASLSGKNPSVHVGFNYMLKPYKGPDWSNRRSAPQFERVTRSISLDEIHGVLCIARDAIKNFESSWDRAVPHYGDNCTWKCDLQTPCKAHRLAQNPIKAFEEEHGISLNKEKYDNKILQEELF